MQLQAFVVYERSGCLHAHITSWERGMRFFKALQARPTSVDCWHLSFLDQRSAARIASVLARRGSTIH